METCPEEEAQSTNHNTDPGINSSVRILLRNPCSCQPLEPTSQTQSPQLTPPFRHTSRPTLPRISQPDAQLSVESLTLYFSETNCENPITKRLQFYN